MADAGADWAAYAEGLRLEWMFQFSPDDLRLFERLSGDHNPVHIDAGFARARGFNAPLIHGLLLASQVSRLIGQELPDTHAVLTALSLTFVSPAFADEALRFEAELVHKSDAAHGLRFSCRISRDAQLLCRGTADAAWRA